VSKANNSRADTSSPGAHARVSEGMRNDGNNKLQGGRGQRSNRSSGFFPTSFRAISSYIRSATSVASTLRSAGASVASSISHAEDDSHRDQVQWAGFDKLELGENISHRVLLLGYVNGFQVWDVEETNDVRELISKQDGPVAFMQMQPRPITSGSADEGFNAFRPLLLVVTGDGTFNGGTVQGGFGGVVGSPPQSGNSGFVPMAVRFYSLRSHSYVHVLRFRSAVYTVRCSSRIIAVALAAQIYCFDAATLQNTFSVLTYPIPQGGQATGSINIGYGPLAVGSRWLAYAANHALVSNNFRVSPQHLTPSPGVSPSTSPASGSLVAHYAKESSRQIAAGIVTLGDMGYKTLTKYYSELLPDGTNSPRSGSPSWKNNCNGSSGHTCELEYAGTVIVRDFVGKSIVAQFRAHSSPLSALCFDPSGTLLVTASVHGHNLNVFRIMPSLGRNGSSSAGLDANASYVHLYKLYRGLTNAVIQDISFSDDSHWIAISSSRGTSHLFAISPFGGAVGLHTHEGTLMDGSRVSSHVRSPTVRWWSCSGLLRANQQPLPPPSPPITLSVVSRIKNGNVGWRGTVSGAAAAATGRTNSSAGAIAAVFRNGGGQTMQSDLGNFSSKNQLWVFFPSGHLIQYSFHVYNGADSVYSGNIASGMGGGTCEMSQEQDLRVVVEILQRWDVCQIPNRTEREENIDNLCKQGTSSGKTGKQAVGSYRNGIIPPHSTGSGGTGKEGNNSEEKRHRYLSNAEVQMHRARTPVWAKSEMYFQVMMPDGMHAEHLNNDTLSGEIEIERIPTRIVEVRTQDLVPVFDHLQDFKEVQEARAPLPGSIPGAKAMHIHQLKDEYAQDGVVGMNLGCVQIQRSSSSSSCSSLSHFSGTPSMVANGYHQGYEDSQEQLEGVFYFNSSATYSHSTLRPTLSQNAALLESSLKSLKVNNRDFNGKSTCQAEKRLSIGPSPMDIPGWSRVGTGNIQVHENSVQIDGGSQSLLLNDCGSNQRYVGKHDALDSAGEIFEGHTINGIELDNWNSSCNKNSKFSESNLYHNGEGHQTGLPTSKLHVTDISMQHLVEDHTRCADLAVSGRLEGILPQDGIEAAGDACNIEHQSKEGGLEKVDHDEDAWEGGMFPFCDEE